MPVTHEFKETIKARAGRDAAFRRWLLREGIECLLANDLETAKLVLRDYVNATLGFSTLAKKTRIPPKSLMRMLSSKGNPRAVHLLGVVAALQAWEGVRLSVKTARVA